MFKEDIKSRIYNVIPEATYEIMELLNLFDIVVDNTKTQTACVSCGSKSIMYINEDFVNKFCKTDEHLFMLIMHELYHIILGHTRMFKAHTDIDNIAFDAIINSMLCKIYPQERYTSFFKSINSSKEFPGLLLRPMDKYTPKKYERILDLLYETNEGTYYDVYQTISGDLDSLFKNCKFILLGNHNGDDEFDNLNPYMKKIVEKMIEKWPEVIKKTGRDLGSDQVDEKITEFVKDQQMFNKMKKLLKESGIDSNTNNGNQYINKNVNVNTYIPYFNYQDRSYYAKKMLLPSQLLFNNPMTVNKLVKESNTVTYVYLDVSGSVDADLKKIFPLLLLPYKEHKIKLFTFSTVVKETNYNNFKEGKYDTTGGTSIGCVFNHFFNEGKIDKKSKKVLILTDGYVENLNDSLKFKIKKEKIQVYVGLFSDSSKDAMLDYVKKFEVFK